MQIPGWLSKIIRFVVFGNIWISLCAASLYWVTTCLHQIPFSPRIFAGIAGATLFIYNYHRLFRKKAIYKSQISERQQWILEHHLQLRLLAISGCALSIFSFLPFLTEQLFLRASPFLFIALLYVIPLWKRGNTWYRFRDIPYLKIVLVAAVWAFVTVFLPFLCINSAWFPDQSVWLTVLQRFLFIFAITLPFDIRDLAYDQEHGLKTFASWLGISKLKTLSRSILVFNAAIALLSFQLDYYTGGQTLALIISCSSTGLLISKAEINAPEMYYPGWLDGTMVDQLFWILFLGNLF